MSGIGSIDFEDGDDLFVRGSSPLPPPHSIAPLSPTAKGISSCSSIERAENRPSEARVRPTLEKPQVQSGNFFYNLADLQTDIERLADTQAKLFEVEVNADLSQVEKLSEEKQEAIRKQIEANKAKDSWSIWVNVSQYLLSGASIALGLSCLPVSPWAGGLLIASGALGLGNRVSHDTGAYLAIASWFTKSDEMQRKLAANIETGVFFASLGLGLAGGIVAYAQGAYAAAQAGANSENIRKGIATAISMGAGVLNGGARFGQAFEQRKISHIQADMTEKDHKIDHIYRELYHKSGDTKKMADLSSESAEKLKEIIESLYVGQD